jgi:hypothetical protein
MDPNTQQPTPQPEQTQQPQPQAPQYQTQQATPQPVQPAKKSNRTKLALWLMIGPTALFIVTFMLFIIVSIVSALLVSGSTSFGTTSAIQSAANILLYLAGGISIIAWLPAMITGIVLLATRPQTNN